MLYRLARTGFFQLDAEKAHDLAIQNFKRFTGTPIDLCIANNYLIDL